MTLADSSERFIEVELATQRLWLRDGVDVVAHYRCSTAVNGPGEQMDSECTPRGRHEIAEKIGAGCAPGTVFVGRQPTGETFSEALKREAPDRDWILTRILWLAGTEPGVNQGGNVDTHARYIYIHGAPDSAEMGVPGSRGCIRLHDADLIELFDRVEVGTPVVIR